MQRNLWRTRISNVLPTEKFDKVMKVITTKKAKKPNLNNVNYKHKMNTQYTNRIWKVRVCFNELVIATT